MTTTTEVAVANRLRRDPTSASLLPPAIEIEHLTKKFGSFTAVDDLTFSVPTGSVFGFLGPNGSGKTTTLGMLLGLMPKDGGRAKILGFDIDEHLSEALAHTGAMVDRAGFYPYLTGRQNLRLFASLAGIRDDAAVQTALEDVDLTARANAKFGGYSTGMKQRLGIAVALIKKPDLLVLDEPTSGLDPSGQREIRLLIQNLARHGQTVILSSHQLHEVQEICTHVAIIDRGKLVATGSLDEILQTADVVEVRVDRVQDAMGIAGSHPDVTAVEGVDGHLVVEMPVERAGSLNRALVAAGIDVRELRPRQSRLEERFLSLTEAFQKGESNDSN